MNQANKWKYCFPIVILGICFINFFCFLLGIEPNLTLYGVSIHTEKPTILWESIFSGSYQEAYQSWFAEHAPFRSLGIKGHAQFMTMLYAPVNGIEIGKHKNLYEEYFTQATLNGTIDDNVFEQYITNLETINQALQQENKVFFYMISPAKVEVYPDDLPWNERLLWKYDKNLAQIRKKLNIALSDRGIPFLDFTELMQQLREEGIYPPFYKTGIHWSQYAVANVVLFFCDYCNQTFGLNLPDMLPQFEKEEKPTFDEEDIKKITNAFWMPSDNNYCSAELILENGEPQERVFAISTSFTHSMLYLFAQNKMPFRSVWRTQYSQFQDKLYYNENGEVVWEGFLPGCSPKEFNYADIFYGSDMVWIESNAPEIPESHIQFANEFAEYIERNAYFTEYIKELYQKEDIAVIITSNYSSELLLNSEQWNQLNQFGITSFEGKETFIGIWDRNRLQVVEEDYFSGKLGTESYTISCSKGQDKNQIVIEYNEKEYISDIGGLNFFVYDKKTAQVMDWVIFDLNQNTMIYR